VLEGAAIEAGFFALAVADLAEQLAGGLAVALTEGFEDRREHRVLGVGRGARAAEQAAVRGADVADAAGLAGVRLVAEMADQVEHAAAVPFGVAEDVVELADLVAALLLIGAAEARVAARDPALGIDFRAAVNPEFFERALEQLRVQLQPPCQILR